MVKTLHWLVLVTEALPWLFLWLKHVSDLFQLWWCLKEVVMLTVNGCVVMCFLFTVVECFIKSFLLYGDYILWSNDYFFLVIELFHGINHVLRCQKCTSHLIIYHCDVLVTVHGTVHDWNVSVTWSCFTSFEDLWFDLVSCYLKCPNDRVLFYGHWNTSVIWYVSQSLKRFSNMIMINRH